MAAELCDFRTPVSNLVDWHAACSTTSARGAAMNEIALLTASDVLHVHSWCQYFAPPELASVFPNAAYPDGCVNKASGVLRFFLNSVADLGIAAPFNFDVEFVGTVESTGMPPILPLVRWDVNQPIGKDFASAGGVTVHVDRVDGVVRTHVIGRSTPLLGADCSGVPRAFPAEFAWLRGFGTGPIIGTDLTFHTVVGGVAKAVTLSWNIFQAQIAAVAAMRLPKVPISVVATAIPGIGEGFTIGGHRFVDPLYDPPKLEELRNRIEGLLRPYSRYQLDEIRHAVDHVAKEAAALLQETDRVIQEREAHAAPETGKGKRQR
jgi:hypothetical protein